ncbi:hypothetical protein [Nitrosovibrio sp. Nv17]|uniref:hypothetical protein n=1 Tax=Nitrosovibrio sp. Nv17 TaxID=1855339 RepID=UPI0009091323|nr:hypothetical protein [Nitrosovibrio sp. Nv17]SFW11887.1 hypothetical protein SAMN05216414_101309 [Nitrosovibrio sp. Nv17]
MRRFALLSLTLLVLPPLFLLALTVLAIEDYPRTDRQVILTPEHIERVKRIVDAHRYQVRPGMLASAGILPGDVDLAANYLAHRLGKGSARIALAHRNARVHLSLPLDRYFIDGYLNLEATMTETTSLPRLESVRIGRLPVPDVLTDAVVPQLIRWLRNNPEYSTGLDALHLVKMSPHELKVIYRWNGNIPRETRTSIVSSDLGERLFRYQSALTSIVRRHGRVIPLPEILMPLARLAVQGREDGDGPQENRALILVATCYVLGVPLEKIFPDAARWPRPPHRTVTLDGRSDFAKHFMVSAAIAAYADTMLSDAIGLYKEIEDSRSGSGFSFNDMAANRAGTRFGARAVSGASSAREIRRRIAGGLRDSDLMPAWSDLPEFMPEAEFKRRFGGIDAPAYHDMMERIDRRVATLPILASPGDGRDGSVAPTSD